jgi:AraC family transcriptional regulator
VLQSISIDPSYQGLLGNRLQLLQDRSQQIPGSIHHSIRRYKREGVWTEPDEGLMVFQLDENAADRSTLELHFLLTGQVYCREKDKNCDLCRLQESENCIEKIDTVDLISFRFDAKHLGQWGKPRKHVSEGTSASKNLNFSASFRRPVPFNEELTGVLLSILNHSYSDSLENIFVNAQAHMLLLHTLELLDGTDDISHAPFLSHPGEREKIEQAREWLIEHIGEPITIKELSRKVAMNECYLKKGFRVMYGTTIFDFYQSQRMEHARYLLHEKGLSVTDVSMLLGYSSISHFSTAFKKYSGLKPCDLLWRQPQSVPSVAQ